jgi:DNA (cytosine-5)-methyltransferase 1
VNELSLFSGGGGGLLGTKLLGFKTIGYVEYEPYCQKVLKARIEDGILDAAPIFGDIRRFISEGYAASYTGMVDVLTAGFPCQPFSVAGKRKGADDERNMWPATIETIRIVQPRFAFMENVPGLLSSGYFGTVLRDLHESGYDARWCVLGADDCGAPHRRKRLWILAYTRHVISKPGSERIRRQEGADINRRCEGSDVAHASQQLLDGSRDARARWWIESADGGEMADASEPGLENRESLPDRETEDGAIKRQDRIYRVSWWNEDPADMANAEEQNDWLGSPGKIERCELKSGNSYQPYYVFARVNKRRPRGAERPTQPRLGRVAHGVAHRVDRLKAIGNGQVPEVVRTAWQILSEGLLAC